MALGGSTANNSATLELLDSRIRVTADETDLLLQLGTYFELAPAREMADLEVHVARDRANPRGGPAPFRITTQPEGELQNRCAAGIASAATLGSALVEWAVGRAKRHYVFHAGAVSQRGRGILLPGASFSGKSTLTVELARRGFLLLSDEVGAIDMTSGELVCFPRALSLRTDVLKLLGLADDVGVGFEDCDARIVSVRELGLERASKGGPPCLVVKPHFEADSPTRMERLRPGPALMVLMGASCSQPRFKVEGLDWVIAMARSVPCFELHFSDFREAVDRIEAALREVGRLEA
jgi:hypothetical protein